MAHEHDEHTDTQTNEQTDHATPSVAIVLIKLPALTVEALWANIGRNCAVWKVTFKRKFRGKGGVVHQQIMASEK